MSRKEVTVQIPGGLEARPIAVLVQVASQYESSVYLETEGKRVNAKSIMGMMSLGIAEGESVMISAEGADEEEAVANIEKYLTSKN